MTVPRLKSKLDLLPDIDEPNEWGSPCKASLEREGAMLHDKDKPWLCGDSILKAEVEV